MGNCIISKLGGSVDNDSLLQLGDMRLYVKSMEDAGYASDANAHKFILKFHSIEDSPSMDILGDGYFTDSTMSQNLGKSITIADTSEKTYYVSDGDYEVVVHTKYHLNKFMIQSVGNQYSAISIDCNTIRCKFDETDNSSKRLWLYGLDLLDGDARNIFEADANYIALYRYNKQTIDLGWIQSSKIKNTIRSIDTSSINLIGKLSDINELPSLSSFVINAGTWLTDPTKNAITGDLADMNPVNTQKMANINLRGFALTTGNVSSLAKFSALITLDLSGSPKFTGELEAFLDAVHANGRVSGTLKVNIGGTSITYNGAPMSGQKTVTFTTEGWTLA